MAGACDTHIHILAGMEEAPLSPTRTEDPAKGFGNAEYLHGYREVMETLGIERVVVVQSILYGTDNAITLAAIEALGRERTRGIALVTDDVADKHLDALAESGVKGVRLNYVHRGVLSWQGAVAMADRLAHRGLHIQMLINADRHMAEIAPDIARLPVPVVFDHIGWPRVVDGVNEDGFRQLVNLVASGHAWVKLSGLYRLCDAPYEPTDALVSALVTANPDYCLWGSDWPFIMLADAKSPDAGTLVNAFHRAVPDSETRQKVLVDNALRLYGFR